LAVVSTTKAAYEDRLAHLGARYRRFAESEAKGRSALYEDLARAVSDDRPTLEWLATLPAGKRQPNLLFAAVRYLHGTVQGWSEFAGLIADDADSIAELMLTRRTQTNEPARCATLLPLLAALPQPLALFEVGAAAGLCLLPDRYSYNFDGRRVGERSPGSAPTFFCKVNAGTPVPARNVEVAWRAGVDLDPIDLCDDEQAAWLEALVWPGEGNRLELLRSAIAVARRDPPIVHRGDLAGVDLPDLLSAAPDDATLVVFHSAVFPYLTDDRRHAFTEFAGTRFKAWVANEGAGLQPRAAAALPKGIPKADKFLLSLNERPIAWTDPHGVDIQWFGSLEV
jgi:hypothetical protein